MKITDIVTTIVHSQRDNWVFTKVFTDEGITGLGESSVEGRELVVREAIASLKQYLVGKDPLQIEKHGYRLYRDAYWGVGAILCGALSAIDGALWDIKGKALGVPVYQLLGGKFREKVRVYANRWFFGAQSPQELAGKALDTVNQGYTALKWDPFGKAEWTISQAQMDSALTQIDAVRKAVGSRADILIEGHGRFNAFTAIQIAREMAPFKPLFFEEPVMPANIDALAEVHEKSPVPIAAGERMYTKYDFRAALERNAVDILQPDLRITGGITEGRKIAALAESRFLQISPHNIHGLVGTAMSLQLMAAIPNAFILEYSVESIPWLGELFDQRFEVVNGYLAIPDRPGLGLEFNEEAARKYPFQGMSLIEEMFEHD